MLGSNKKYAYIMTETRGAVPFKRSTNVEAPTRLRLLTAAYVLVDTYKKILQSLTAHMHGCMHCRHCYCCAWPMSMRVFSTWHE